MTLTDPGTNETANAGAPPVAFNPFEPGFFDDPSVQLNALREQDAVHYIEFTGGFMVTRYHDVVRLGRDRTIGSTVAADRDGSVAAIDNQRMAQIARLAGAPLDKGAGVDLYKKVGDPVKRGEPLYGIHAEFDADFAFACEAAARHDGFTLSQ